MQKENKEGFYLNKTWTLIFEIIVFLGIALIFLNALGWLDLIFEYIGGVWGSETTAAILMIAVVVGFMFFITRDTTKKGETKKES